jgi:hypothetical protein
VATLMSDSNPNDLEQECDTLVTSKSIDSLSDYDISEGNKSK